jgi:hypothetical protein
VRGSLGRIILVVVLAVIVLALIATSVLPPA